VKPCICSFRAQLERDEAYRALEALKLELEHKNAELAQLSMQDGLTSLANRRRFDLALLTECGRAKRDGSSLSLLLIDVDHFKKYNDTYGHQAGDDCLKRVARALAEAVRRPADIAARYGGEEFALILPGTSAEGAGHVAEGVRLAVEALGIPHSDSSAARHVTISLGVVTVQSNGALTPKELIAAADLGLYAAKRSGRNRPYDDAVQLIGAAVTHEGFRALIQVPKRNRRGVGQ